MAAHRCCKAKAPTYRPPGITLDGGGIPLPARRGLIHCLGGRDIRITDCEIAGSGGNGIWFEQVSGDVSGNIVTAPPPPRSSRSTR